MTVATNSPTTNTGTAWTNPANAYADGGGVATITSAKPSGNNVWGTYGFSLTGYTITQVRVRYDALTGGNEQIRIDVSWDGGTTWSAQQVTALSGTETTYWYDVTAETAWTPAKLADGQLQVRADAYSVGGAGSVSLDWLPVEVTYSTGGTTNYQTIPATAIGTGVLASVSTFARALSVVAVGVNVLSRLNSFYRTLTSTAVASPSLIKGMYRTLSATTVGTALLTTAKMFTRSLIAVASGIAGLSKIPTYVRTLLATAVGTATLTRISTFYKTLTSTATGIATVSKVVAHYLVLASTAIGTATITTIKTFVKALVATVSGLANLAAQFITGGGGQTYYKTLSAIAISKASFRFTLGRVLKILTGITISQDLNFTTKIKHLLRIATSSKKGVSLETTIMEK